MSKRVLGLWNMGEGLFHRQLSPDESKTLIRQALSFGISCFDTAFSYRNADNYLAAVIKERGIERESIEIISKVMAVPTLEKKVDTSLRRLGSDYLDILLLHWPAEEELNYASLIKLEKIKERGKAKAIGVSNFPLDMLAECMKDFDITHHERALSLLWKKEWKEEKALGLKTIAYAPLAMGLLSKTEAELKSIKDRRAELEVAKSKHLLPLLKKIAELSYKHESSPAEIALSWVEGEKPEYIAQGFSDKKQLPYKAITLPPSDKMALDAIADEIEREAKSDNIFSHSYLSQRQ